MSTLLENLKAQIAQLPPKEQQAVLHELRDAVLKSPPRKPASLRGMWKGHFPEGFDFDSALREIRSEWQKKLDGIAG